MRRVFEECTEAAVATEAETENNNTSTSSTRAEGELLPAHNAKWNTMTRPVLWVDRFSFFDGDEYTYTIDNFLWVECETDQEMTVRMERNWHLEVTMTRFAFGMLPSTKIWTTSATAGVVNDSTATVIGAMIVAPLTTPILGTMLAIVLTDLPNFLFSLFHVLAGAGSAIFIGYIYGLVVEDDKISKVNNSQIANRIKPNIDDLISALAKGAVGSIALVCRDIAGSLPGVAIAISLIPPLCVIGLTLSRGGPRCPWCDALDLHKLCFHHGCWCSHHANLQDSQNISTP